MSGLKLSPIRWTDFVKKLKSFGFDVRTMVGKQPYLIRGDLVLTVPALHRAEISVDLLVRVLRHARISREEWTGHE